MVDENGNPTTGLLTGPRYAKDNRLLPNGFDKATAVADIAVVGEARLDSNFTAGGDRVRYSIDVGAGRPLEIRAELRFQPISFRWADNLRKYDSSESRKFMSYWDSMSGISSELIAGASASGR